MNVLISIFLICIWNKESMMGTINGAGNAHPSLAPGITSGIN